MSEKGKIAGERSSGGSRRTQREQELQPERSMDAMEDQQPQVEEALRQRERKPNRG